MICLSDFHSMELCGTMSSELLMMLLIVLKLQRSMAAVVTEVLLVATQRILYWRKLNKIEIL